MDFQPAVCGDLSYRTAVVRTGNWPDMTTAEVQSMSYEIIYLFLHLHFFSVFVLPTNFFVLPS